MLKTTFAAAAMAVATLPAFASVIDLNPGGDFEGLFVHGTYSEDANGFLVLAPTVQPSADFSAQPYELEAMHNQAQFMDMRWQGTQFQEGSRYYTAYDRSLLGATYHNSFLAPPAGDQTGAVGWFVEQAPLSVFEHTESRFSGFYEGYVTDISAGPDLYIQSAAHFFFEMLHDHKRFSLTVSTYGPSVEARVPPTAASLVAPAGFASASLAAPVSFASTSFAAPDPKAAASVPEPAPLAALGVGAVALGVVNWYRKRVASYRVWQAGYNAWRANIAQA